MLIFIGFSLLMEFLGTNQKRPDLGFLRKNVESITATKHSKEIQYESRNRHWW